MDIDDQVIERTSLNLHRILTKHQSVIERAFDNAEEAVVVGLTVEFKPKGEGIKLKTAINFVVERRKDFFEDEVYPPDPISTLADAIAAEREHRQKIGNTPGEWTRLRAYRHM